jgi:hypothetical protein
MAPTPVGKGKAMSISGHDLIRTDPRLALQIRRYHTWPVNRYQDVGSHSAQVCRIYRAITPEPDIAAMDYILTHDLGEIACGDPPYPIKAENPTLKAECDRIEAIAVQQMSIGWGVPIARPSAYQMLLIRFSHQVEMAEYGIDELLSGNVRGMPVAERCLNDAFTYLDKLDSIERNAAAIYVHTRLEYTRLQLELPKDKEILQPHTWMRAANA